MNSTARSTTYLLGRMQLYCRLNCKVVTLLDNLSGASIRVVGLRCFVMLCKIAPYRNSLTYLLTYNLHI